MEQRPGFTFTRPNGEKLEVLPFEAARCFCCDAEIVAVPYYVCSVAGRELPVVVGNCCRDRIDGLDD